MATIKLSTTGNASRLISYAEKRAVELECIDCSPEYAKVQFKTTRELYGKTDGVQAHHIIQSFKPREISSEGANKIGLELARKLAKGYECIVYTHADKEHIHNHIVINSVNYENGKKLHLHGKQAIDKVRQISDELCKEQGLSIVKEHNSEVRYTLAEQGILKRGDTSWKDELRQVIDYEKVNSKSYEDFKKNLIEKYGIEVNDTKKHITYKHPDRAKVVRGNKLGAAYERGVIENGFSRQIERNQRTGRIEETTREFTDRNQRTKQTYAELHKGSIERKYDEESYSRERTGTYEKDKPRHTKEDGINIREARKHAEELRRESSSSYGKWKSRNDKEQSKNIIENGTNRREIEQESQRDRERTEQQLKRNRGADWDLSL